MNHTSRFVLQEFGQFPFASCGIVAKDLVEAADEDGAISQNSSTRFSCVQLKTIS